MLAHLILALGTAAEPGAVAVAPDEPEIVVTASLAPVARPASPATMTTIDAERIDALGEPLALDLLRLVPSVSIASSGPPGSQAQLRIRGAEANHTLLLIDGIRFNDPAAGNEARFELLSNDGIGRIEVVRGPQSALYGAEAIGGVVAIQTGQGRAGTSASATAEAGGKGNRRLSAAAGHDAERAALGFYGGYQESGGIDSFAGGGPGGERDGFSNLTFGGSARAGRPDGFSVAAAARFTEALSAFDGFDPQSFARADTLDSTRNRLGAGRISARYGDPATSGFHAEVGGSLLGSTNRNRLAGDPLNRTDGRRTTVDALASVGLATGAIEHKLIVAGDYEHERFVAGDQQFGGATNQRRTRDRGAVVAELRSALGDRITTDIAVRHDSFGGFRDATTLRAAVVGRLAGPLSALLSYGEGIARPTFFDLFGFFPGSFAGNPAIRPERSRGGEIGLRYDGPRFEAGLTAYNQRLRDEIVGVFDPLTFISSTANATGKSRRRGLEIEATWRPFPALRVSGNYSLVDADERTVAGAALVKEVRRPRHSANWSPTRGWAR
jgi:vitamin B12 transporter